MKLEAVYEDCGCGAPTAHDYDSHPAAWSAAIKQGYTHYLRGPDAVRAQLPAPWRELDVIFRPLSGGYWEAAPIFEKEGRWHIGGDVQQVRGLPTHVRSMRMAAEGKLQAEGKYRPKRQDDRGFVASKKPHEEPRFHAREEAPRAEAPRAATPDVYPEAIGQQCRPYMKIERDPVKFKACQTLADSIGPLDSTEKVAKVLMEAVGHEVAERFGVVTLDTHFKLRDIAETGAGETDAVMAPMVPTLQTTLASSPTYVILYHVHPAASQRPSDADVEVTKGFAKAFKTVGVEMLDHIIVAPGSKKGFYSFKDSKPEALKA